MSASADPPPSSSNPISGPTGRAGAAPVALGSSSGTGGSDALASASSATSPPAWLGKRVGRFRLVGEIGRGAMGRVFRAEDTTLNRHVALKVLPNQTRSGSVARQFDRFLREARAAAGLDHPGIVTVYEVGEHRDVYSIAMELVEGGNLDALVRAGGSLDIARACVLAAEAAEALQHAHAAGVVHRDIKPSNLLLTRTGRCKITDFGLAEIRDANEHCDLDDRSVGTPLYVAPEVIRGGGATARSDIYSLGATLHFLLCGQPPFPAPDKAAALARHLNSPVPDVRSIRVDVPETLALAIQRCLAKDPAERFPDAGALASVLRVHTIPVALSGSSLVGSSAAATPAQAVRHGWLQNHWLHVLASGAVTVILLAAVVLLILSNGRQRDAGEVPSASTTATPPIATAPPPTIQAAPERAAGLDVERPPAAQAVEPQVPQVERGPTTPAGAAALTRLAAAPRGGTSVGLANGSFEEQASDDPLRPAAWLASGEIALDGAARQQGLVGIINRGERSTIAQTVAVEPDTVYTLSAWARLRDTVASECQCIFVSSGREELRAWIDSTQGRRYAITFRTGPTVTEITIGSAEMKGSRGSAELDDFELVRHAATN